MHWRNGGLTDADNLVSVCPFHHDANHRDEFTISGDPIRHDGLEFLTSKGVLIGPGLSSRPRSAHAPDPPERHLSVVPAGRGPAGAVESAVLPRPEPRTGRTYLAPTGDVLHLSLAYFTPHTGVTTQH